MKYLVVIFFFASLLYAQQPDSSKHPVPKLIQMEAGTNEYVRLLGGPPETSTMHSGLVTLLPGKSIGKHSTERFEEMVIVLEGEGKMFITNRDTLSFKKGDAIYSPANTEHDVLNTGKSILRYVYVVAETEPKNKTK